MREIIEKIFNDYLYEKANHHNDKENKLVDYLNTNCASSYYDTEIINKEKYSIGFSTGNGDWAHVPWIAILDPDISDTVSKGYDIVYLFSADMKKVYLSLNQGWTYFKTKYKKKYGKDKISKVTEIWQSLLKSNLGAFNYDPINLEFSGKTTDLPEGYELGHICGKCYYADKLPNEDILKLDLQNMLSLFRELKGHMINNYSIEDTNNYLLAEAELRLLNNEERTNNDKSLERIISDKGENTELKISNSVPKEYEDIEQGSGQNSYTKKGKIDYNGNSKKQQRIGLAGEYMVLNYEKNNLSSWNSNKTVEHVSKTQGDGAGYDIKSYDRSGIEIHIEVKTTEGNIETPYYISANEVRHSKENSKIYRLYRIYNFNPQEGTGDFYIIEGDITQKVELKTKTYVSAGMKK